MRIVHLTEDQIFEYLDDQRRGYGRHYEAYRRHLRWCNHCRTEAADYEALCADIGECKAPELSQDFTGKVMARVKTVPGPTESRVSMWVSLIAPLVALGSILYLVDPRPLLNRAFVYSVNLFLSFDHWLSDLTVPSISLPGLDALQRALASASEMLAGKAELYGLAAVVLLAVAIASMMDSIVEWRIIDRR
ncbi:MAG: hypothetical protein JSU65_00630 [Candidatus Zixiibacteriota bacterium]|nr:MAG: hypothetical protein JSU65_00630 [candidate division Zixibacteria bacterium]